MNTLPQYAEVLVIGAGPSGAVAAANLVQKGHKVLVLERQVFPRFSIGESLLPQCMVFLEEANMLEAVQAANFQFKNGAAFRFGDHTGAFDFEKKFSPGWGTTFQVERAKFDKILADRAAELGADIRYEYEILAVTPTANGTHDVKCKCPDGSVAQFQAGFILDASGFGRVLPRLLELDRPSDFPVRQSVFTHVRDNFEAEEFDRHKILVNVHPQHRDVWIWTIPFVDGRCSLGVVAEPAFFEGYRGTLLEKLQAIVAEVPHLSRIFKRAEFFMPAREILGYSANVSSLYGAGFALLGNAGEFLDPVFSSGVTIALKSASLASELLHRQLIGESIDWQADYAEPLMVGVNVFRTFVSGWYNQDFQDVIFSQKKSADITAMISSILAGYAWDTRNPYVADSNRRLSVLAQVCREL